MNQPNHDMVTVAVDSVVAHIITPHQQTHLEIYMNLQLIKCLNSLK